MACYQVPRRHYRQFKNCVNYCIYSFFNVYHTSMASSEPLPYETKVLLERARKSIPTLEDDKHKGNAGRVGVIGGSLEYTGAPYFAALSAIKVGADLVHVFCQRSAASVIKSYSPELIVHPLLDCENPLSEIEPWLERLHVLVIGPGLGREKQVMNTVIELICICKENHKPIIIDADGLHIITQNKDLLKGYENAILTPNAIEFTRLFGSNPEKVMDNIRELGNGVTVLEKGKNDVVYMPKTRDRIELPGGGSARRCGGQGDLLAGALATLYYWALNCKDPNPAFIAAFSACYLTKQCNAYAFKKYGRSAVCSNMIDEIHNVFNEYFEHKKL